MMFSNEEDEPDTEDMGMMFSRLLLVERTFADENAPLLHLSAVFFLELFLLLHLSVVFYCSTCSCLLSSCFLTLFLLALGCTILMINSDGQTEYNTIAIAETRKKLLFARNL